MIQSSLSGETCALRSISAAALAASVTSVSSAETYASDNIPARWRNFPAGMSNAASTSSDGTIREPNATAENRNTAVLSTVDIKIMRPHRALAL
jgi:hypothetical protein